MYCNDEVHRQAIDWFAIEVLEAVQTAAEETLPTLKILNEKDNQLKIEKLLALTNKKPI